MPEPAASASLPVAAPGSRRNAWLAAILFLLYAGTLLGWQQLGQEALTERDGYFHARFSHDLPELGLTRAFPWTQFSTWKDRFCDKEFLFHVWLVPFAQAGAEPLAGVRAGIWLLSLAVPALLFWVLKKQGVPLPWLFALLLFCAGGPFLIRLTMIRSHVLSISLLLLGAHFLLRKNWKALFALGFVYAWSYTVPFVLVMTAAPFAAGRWFSGGGLDWKSVLAAGAGAVAGLILHPYSPHTLESFFTYVDVITSGARGVGEAVELGMEIYPYRGQDFFFALPLLAAAFVLLPVLGWRRNSKGFWIALAISIVWVVALAANPKLHTKAFMKQCWFVHLPLLAVCVWGWKRSHALSPEAGGALWAALFWCNMTMLFARFNEYAVPLTALAVGLLVRDRLAGIDLEKTVHEARGKLLAGACLLAVPLLAAHGYSLHVFRETWNALPPQRFQPAAAWLDERIAAGETVVNFWWDDFPELYYHTRKAYFLVGLDPTYMQRFTPEKLQLLENLRRRGQGLNGPLLAQTFGARYMIMRASVRNLYPEFVREYWKPVFKDDYALVFELTGPGAYAPPDAVPGPAVPAE